MYCVCGVGKTSGGYTSDCDRGGNQRILPEYEQLGTTASGVE